MLWYFTSNSLNFLPLSAMMLNRSFDTTLLLPTALYQTVDLILLGIPSVQSSLTLAVDLRLSQSTSISFSQTLLNFSSFWIWDCIFLSAVFFSSIYLCMYYCLFFSTNSFVLAASSSDFWGRLGGLKFIGSRPLGTSVLPLLTAMNLRRSLHSWENTLPRVFGMFSSFWPMFWYRLGRLSCYFLPVEKVSSSSWF